MLYTDAIVAPSQILKMAKDNPPLPIAVVCAHHPNIMETMKQALARNLCIPYLLGKADKIHKLANEYAIPSEKIIVIDCGEEDAHAANIAVEMVHKQEVSALMKGHIHTDVLMRAVVASGNGLRTERRISHVFVMSFPNSDRLLMITDAAVNIQPDEKGYQGIISNVIDCAHKIGYAFPKIALLSASEDVLSAMPSSVLADNATRWAAQVYAGRAIVEGPFALDNAVSLEAAKLKGIERQVAGNADIVVVPDIVSGNILFKTLVYFCGACASGIVLGAKVPIVLTSRADPVEAKIASIALAAKMSS